MKIALASVLVIFSFTGCDPGKGLAQHKDESSMMRPEFTPGPPTLVYKTKKDYANHVPVLLSADKSSIVSYPDPRDLRNGEHYQLPEALQGGYLLDQRGIGAHVAFLKLTYEEYAALDRAPGLKELMNMIIDNDPLSELCDCGNRQAFSDVTSQLNAIIKAGRLRSVCKVIR